MEPIWLWGLCGLIVPLAIHLLSRREGRIIPIGSLRYLRESATAKYKHLRLNETALLLLRCLLLMLMVFLLAQARSSWFPPPPQKWVVLEEGVTRSPQIRSMIESLEQQGFEIRLMATGFPLASEGTFREPVDNYWAAVGKLASQPLDSVVVISFNYQRNFKGERISMPPNMNWVVTQGQKKEFIAETVLADNDTVWVRAGESSSFITTFETRKAPPLSVPDSVPVSAPTDISISIVSAQDFAYDKKILLAALKAIQAITPHKIRITTKNVNELSGSSEHVIFWLANEIPSVAKEAVTIAYRDCIRKNLPLLIPSAEADHDCHELQDVSWVLTRRLNEETALKENFTLQLAGLILPGNANNQYDQRVLPESMMWTDENENESESADQKHKGKMDFLLTVLLLLTLVAERTLAFKRNQ